MKKFLPILLLISSCSTQPGNSKIVNADTIKAVETLKPKLISDSTNTLTGNIENLELEYIVWGCACANWITIADKEKYKDSGLAAHSIFIEPATENLILPIYFDAARHRLKLKGQFYTKPGYPQGTIETEEHLDKAMVFRYTNLEVVDNPDFKPISKIKTLVLSYNAISCTCAQWSESKFDNKDSEEIHYWLEPSNKKLISANTLFDGENLPLQVKVTGQVVSEKGFPKTDLSKVGQEEASTVFRYTKIEILKNGQKRNRS